MTIETKFNIGDEIYYFNKNGKFQHNKVIDILCKVPFGNAPIITYVTDTDDEIIEGGAFKDPEELYAIISALKP